MALSLPGHVNGSIKALKVMVKGRLLGVLHLGFGLDLHIASENSVHRRSCHLNLKFIRYHNKEHDPAKPARVPDIGTSWGGIKWVTMTRIQRGIVPRNPTVIIYTRYSPNAYFCAWPIAANLALSTRRKIVYRQCYLTNSPLLMLPKYLVPL